MHVVEAELDCVADACLNCVGSESNPLLTDVHLEYLRCSLCEQCCKGDDSHGEVHDALLRERARIAVSQKALETSNEIVPKSRRRFSKDGETKQRT